MEVTAKIHSPSALFAIISEQMAGRIPYSVCALWWRAKSAALPSNERQVFQPVGIHSTDKNITQLCNTNKRKSMKILSTLMQFNFSLASG